MGCDAIFFLDSDLLQLSKEEKYKEVVNRIGHSIPNIDFISWDTIENRIHESGFYTFNYYDDDERLKLFYVDSTISTIYEFWFEKNFVEFDLYDYSEHCSGNIFYVDRWYLFLDNYLGFEKHKGIIEQVNKIKVLIENIIAPVIHCKNFLGMGDQVLLHERVEDLMWDKNKVVTIEDALKLYPQLKFFDNENAFEYVRHSDDDEVLTFLYKVKQF